MQEVITSLKAEVENQKQEVQAGELLEPRGSGGGGWGGGSCRVLSACPSSP